MNLILIKLNLIETSVEKNLFKNFVTQHSLAYKNKLIYGKKIILSRYPNLPITIFGYRYP